MKTTGKQANRTWRSMLFAGYVVMVAIIATYAISFGAQHRLLVPLAIPFAIALIAAVFWLPSAIQLKTWGFLTFWLLSFTYLGHGNQEYVAMVVITVLSLLGAFKSPWFLVATWALHPLWDMLVHRTLAPPMQHLPAACVLCDPVIALYLIFFIRQKLALTKRSGNMV